MRRVSVLRDQNYMDWLKGQLCTVCKYRYPGDGPDMTMQTTDSEPAHTLNNGRSSKGPDNSCIPLCHQHHAEMDGRAGTKIVTKEAFAAKYDIDLAAIAAQHYERFKKETA